MRRCAAALLLALVGLACGGTPERDPCPEAALLRYGESVKAEILARWEPPRDLRGGHTAMIEYKLSAEGTVSSFRTEAEDPEIARSVEKAFLAAQPFPRPPAPAACLVRTPLRARFYLTAGSRSSLEPSPPRGQAGG